MQDDKTLTGSAKTLTGSASGDEPETGTDAQESETIELPENEASENEASENDAEKSAEEDAPAPEPARKQSRIDKRIGGLIEDRRKAEERLLQAEGTIARLQNRLAQAGKQASPDPGDYYDDAEYHAALAQHYHEQAAATARSEEIEDAKIERDAAAAAVHRADIDAFNARLDTFRHTATDYDQVVAGITVSEEAARQILASDQGPQISYYLGVNRAEAARLASNSDPRAVAREIGRIEGRLQQPAPNKVTSAPRPMGAVVKGSGNHADFDPSRASVDDMEARLKAKGVIS